ncbi:MAG: pantoate--beta-alanine ligase [Bacteroidota bacterium]|nr:pantoate--beta-alanine ligase [Bacteroidota bacterium]
MIIFKQVKDLTKYLQKQQAAKNSIGFVPTMGALHEGHLSLLKECKKMSKITVCSIFVNPTQFNNTEDLDKYPKSVSNDILLLEQNECNVLFLPDEKEIYPDERSKQKHFDLGYLETILEGEFRPGHFQGVSLVVEKLLKIVNPDFLFLGQKDFQQCLIIKRLVGLMNRNIKIIICPILREESGLAMSSRNLRLSFSDRKLASELFLTLVSIKNKLKSEDFLKVKDQAIQDLETKGFKVEYLELAKKNNLEIVSHFNPREKLIILIAAFLGDVRLIDNLLINP